MNVFYEESGSLKVASIIEDNNTSLQVQTQHGKRAKVKAAAVLLRFEHHCLNEFMERARLVADELEPGFLWEACDESEFSFDALADAYFGDKPTAEEAAGLLMRLQATPTHFYKKGKGRYKPAPPEALKATLASIERKREQAQLQAEYVQSLLRNELPDDFKPVLNQLLYKPDRKMLQTKAVEEACSQLKLSVPRLFEQCGALESTLEYHHGRFLFEHFPRGTGFDDKLAVVQTEDYALADVEAFSIDDVTTTEIDDAFSVSKLDNGHWQVGVHISAPALGIEGRSALDAEARKRMSTVYFPGGKITMLPEPVIDRFTLAEGRECPALSMYVEVDSDFQVVGTRSAIERVRIACNMHHNVLDVEFDEQAVHAGRTDFAFGEQLLFLYRLAGKLERARGQDERQMRRTDYSFYVDNDRVRIEPRKRGAPIDKVVSEMMILVNSRWAQLLAESNRPALFRTQASGKVKMSTVAAPHEGLGVNQYIWASSPLRRYADLVNQRQLISILRGAQPAFVASDQELFEIMRGFELAYDAYAEFQRRMERYWCLRWLLQEQVTEMAAEVIRDNLVRFECLPLVCRVHSLPSLAPGDRVQISVSGVDLMEMMVRCEYKKTLEPIGITA
ncbi:MAG: RNB domain-containing ribonuclease [Betaproteobacteria bacterium]|jgi:exoribonuclease-2|nr:MAG: RNB domain-containing ribonuclease [Betaproteobacteria bacterium]